MPDRMLFRPTKAIINLDAIKDNVKALNDYLGNETSIIAVVKADGYGHGDVETAQATIEAGAKMVSVATPEEAV
ncbi:alanine racemase, partial [Microvirga sp. 3-52]|nr:alanine racemase [Microvirga sp. 3-52]